MDEVVWVVIAEPGMGDGMYAANPVTEDGSVMVGITLLTDLDGVREHGALRIVEVDNLDYKNPRVIWEDAEAIAARGKP